MRQGVAPDPPKRVMPTLIHWAIFAFLVDHAAAVKLKSEEEKNRPVTKVVNVMKDMIKQLEKEGEEDEEIFESIGCWCTTGEKEKTKSITDATERITVLESAIQTATADSARLNAEVANLQKELGKNANALAEAEALRAKQSAEFTTEEKETIASISSLKGAVQVLSTTAGATSFLQVEESTAAGSRLVNAMGMVRRMLRRHAHVFGDSLKRHAHLELERFATFAKHPRGISLLQVEAPASGAIFGILQQMKEDFETSLSSSRKEETTAVGDYNGLRATKKEEISAAEDLVETKTGEIAEADEKVAAGKQDLELTEASLAADNAFLAELKVKCTNVDAEFEERTRTRQLEMQAVTKALQFLTSDEAHDLFSRTFNPALVQTGRQSSSARRAAVKFLKAQAKRLGNPALLDLSVQVRIDAFEDVKRTITDMINKLLKEKQDDVIHKDYCIDEFNTNEKDTAAKKRDKEKIEASIDDYSMTIETLNNEITTLKAEIAELQANQKTASEERTKANKEFQQTLSDQRATQKLLAQAKKILEGFYNKAALEQVAVGAQRARADAEAGPPGFKKQESSAAAGGVMGMIQKIIDDAKSLEAEALHGEEEAQADFEEFTKDTTATIAAKTKDSVNKAEAMAKAENDRVQAEVERDAALQNLEELAQGNHDLHNSCDFLLKNFDVRIEARDAEVEALKQGLAMFSGANFAAMLQRP